MYICVPCFVFKTLQVIVGFFFIFVKNKNMTRTIITLVYDDGKYLSRVLNDVAAQVKEGIQRGKFARLGITAEYQQEISIDISTLDVRTENGCLIIKSKV